VCHLDIQFDPSPETDAIEEGALHCRLILIEQAGGYHKMSPYLPKVHPDSVVRHMVVAPSRSSGEVQLVLVISTALVVDCLSGLLMCLRHLLH
jgi:hypothetical protein